MSVTNSRIVLGCSFSHTDQYQSQGRNFAYGKWEDILLQTKLERSKCAHENEPGWIVVVIEDAEKLFMRRFSIVEIYASVIPYFLSANVVKQENVIKVGTSSFIYRYAFYSGKELIFHNE